MQGGFWDHMLMVHRWMVKLQPAQGITVSLRVAVPASTSDLITIEVFHGSAISVDLTAESDRGQNLVAHDLVSLILGNLDGEETCMCLRKRLIVHVAANIYTVSTFHARQITW